MIKTKSNKGIQIGKFFLEGNVILAPLAGYSDLAFRIICEEFGASMTVTEMVNAKGLSFGDEKTLAMLDTTGQKKPVSVQIFGSEPEFMARAAEIVSKMEKFDIIDINMGCPVPKVVKNGEGSALMRTPQLAGQIVRKVKENTNLPVTAKFRKGWSNGSVNAVEFAKILEENGADALCIHGRTRDEFFSGNTDINIIFEVKKAVNIPVIGNGDVKSAQDVENMMDITGCDGIMIGRGAVGNPMLFRQIQNFYNGETNLDENREEDRITEKLNVLIKHYNLAKKLYGNDSAVLNMRKHAHASLKGLNNSSKLKDKINNLESIDDVIIEIENYRGSYF